jgi:hypothetical protein
VTGRPRPGGLRPIKDVWMFGRGSTGRRSLPGGLRPIKDVWMFGRGSTGRRSLPGGWCAFAVSSAAPGTR